MSETVPIGEEELALADNRGLLERQTRVLDLLASSAGLEEVLRAVTVALDELLPGARCSILLLDPKRGTLHHGAAAGLPARYLDSIDSIAIGPDAGSCGTAAYLGSRIVVADIETDALWEGIRDIALRDGLRSCWSQPIFGRDGAVLGTFAVYHGRPHTPPERETRLVDRFAHLASVAIEHANLYGALAESEARFRRAFEDNAVGMALADLDGRLTKVNRALRQLLRLSEKDLLGASITGLVRADKVDDAARALRALVRGACENVQFETVCTAGDGAELVVAATASVVHEAGGQPMYLSLNLLDLTQQRAAEAERRARREAEVAQHAAEASSRAKSEFLSSLSHEIRTPLQAITGFAELLRRLDLTAERRQEALRQITEAGEHILALADDVLDIAKMEAGAIEVRSEQVRLRPLAEEVVALLEPLANQQIDLRLRGPDVAVPADRRRLRQVLINLVTNAIRHNERGGQVLVRTVRGEGRALLQVIDSGPGIDHELQQRLFVPFQRLDADRRGVPGAGLGLPLARGLTEAMGGRLRIRSSEGVGTTAEVELPI
ncbi:GAF domain-containing sensor histidine kinase [Amycolatopsis cihanbeyliensis]|uniref:histidine kinase n=1 Tax=Amycolatopsis cihanbeyliensis TaxID=1128664 RepID=A0A542DFI8_AMYCI|nr:GAF domain-containing sensor histidine kinase [Amycolatopsis cihanbeyliensis]TQJ01845.1 PAS domain S-box-containing protein [Amycolatopsis cihanbeyliensis]